ncbi:MAG: pyridoxal-phosphate dependent enzyme [Spirosomataceae bacterium]
MDFLPQLATSPLEPLLEPLFEKAGVKVWLKRDDLLHPQVSGNKWRKLKYNLLEARRLGYTRLLTFGGAYSNHLYAVAAAGRLWGFETVGIVRGNEHRPDSNPTLRFCAQAGMRLRFVTRSEYREPALLTQQYGQGYYVLPEGGTNQLAYKGLHELMSEIKTELKPDFVCVAVGTGGTATGLCQVATDSTKILGFSVLKDGKGLPLEQLYPFFNGTPTSSRCTWISDYHIGGYAKTSPLLINFIRAFEKQHGILLEQVYTGKMLFGMYDLVQKGVFPKDSTLVAVHTGGLQGRISALDSSQNV